MRIVIAEPDSGLADLLAFVARRRGHRPLCVPGPDRLFGPLPFDPSVAIVSFPELDSMAVETIARIRDSFPAVPVLVTAESAPEPWPTRALQAGAVDIIRVPYNPYDVIMRAESRQVVAPPTAESESIAVGDLEVDLDAFAARKNGVILPLTRLELRLLYCLGEHSPNVAPIDRLLAFGWDSLEEPDASLLKTHISHIRKKMRDAGGEPLSIVARQSIGYQLSA